MLGTVAIYIHGTPQERTIGKAASYGCVRMRSHDVVEVFDAAPIGTTVTILAQKLPRSRKARPFKILSASLRANRNPRAPDHSSPS